MLKRYSVARARENLARVLDQAEQGLTVVIERRGVRFAIQTVDEPPSKRVRRTPRIEHVDETIASGQWTWSLGKSGMKLKLREVAKKKQKKR